MDQNPKRREDYRARRSSLNLHRNRAFAADASALRPGNFLARLVGVVALLAVCFGVA